MKRYLLFAFDTFYPSGGMNDFVSDFDTLDQAKGAVRKRHENVHIYDSQARRIVYSEGDVD